MPQEAPSFGKPKEVVLALGIAWGLLIYSLARNLIAADSKEYVLTTIPFHSAVAFLIYKVSAGRDWARRLYCAYLGAVVAFASISLIRQTEMSLCDRASSTALAAFCGLVIYLLFHRVSNQWFKRIKPDAV
jgi:hypothetical protein